ncbi:MAG: SUMF1/EgtB/PvdO family nonheme iron enzyme [Pirellulaceae bacterium]
MKPGADNLNNVVVGNRNSRRLNGTSWASGFFTTLLYLVLICTVLFTAESKANAEDYALLIAVQQYDRTQMNSLNYTENDINELAATLKKIGYDENRIYVMTQTVGASKTRFLPVAANIKKEIETILKLMGPNDSILIAFSGHGVQYENEDTNYFCPADVDLKDRDKLVDLNSVFSQLEESQARRKILLVDACRDHPQSEISKSSKTIKLTPAEGRAPPVVEGGTVALFSCSATESSYEDPELNHGIFFNFVIKGLNGDADLVDDKQITFEELTAYTSRAVKDYTFREFGRFQTPSTSLSDANIGTVIVANVAAKNNKVPDSLKCPFDSRTASDAQSRWAEYFDIDVYSKGQNGIMLALIPPGEFEMGSPRDEEGRNDNEVLHRVRLTQPFLISCTEVTKGQFAEFLRSAKYKTDSERNGKGSYGFIKNASGQFEWSKSKKIDWNNPGFPQKADEPVVNVSWNDAIAFCNWMSRQKGCAEYYLVQGDRVIILGGEGYRLPTEAEWEFACRAGSSSRFSFGDDQEALTRFGNTADASARQAFNWSKDSALAADDHAATTAQVAEYKANAFGLYDMHGNVWEWCWDWFSEYGDTPETDPTGAQSGHFRVFRGGSWLDFSNNCRSAYRFRFAPTESYSHLGFRIASSLPKSTSTP